MTNAAQLIIDAAHLRAGILGALELYPDSEPLVNAIAVKLDLSDLADGPHDSADEGERKENARRERTLANLRERALALIELHPDVEDLLKPWDRPTRPVAGTAPFSLASGCAICRAGSDRHYANS
jgi:hypothetical protein